MTHKNASPFTLKVETEWKWEKNVHFSCAPSWESTENFGYNVYLITLGFFLPLAIILYTSASVIYNMKEVRVKVSFIMGLIIWFCDRTWLRCSRSTFANRLRRETTRSTWWSWSCWSHSCSAGHPMPSWVRIRWAINTIEFHHIAMTSPQEQVWNEYDVKSLSWQQTTGNAADSD